MNAVTLRANLCIACVLACLSCTTHIVGRSAPTVVSSRPVRTYFQLETCVEPSVAIPVATFLSQRVDDTERRREEVVKYTRQLSSWGRWGTLGGAVLGCLAGVATYTISENETATILGASVVFYAALVSAYVWYRDRVRSNLARAGITRPDEKTLATVDTVPIKTPHSLDVYVDERFAMTLSPGKDGVARLDLREWLSTLGDTPRDIAITVRAQGADSVRQTVAVSRAVLASAVEQHRAEMARQEREAREQRLAEKLAQRREKERRAHLGDSLVSAALELKAVRARYAAAEYVLKYRTPLSEVEQGARQLASMAERDYPAYMKYGRLLNEYVAAFGGEALYALSLRYGFSDLLR